FFQHSEGRVLYDNGSFNYEYNLTDHLGNVRVTLNQAGTVIQKDDYYPFGLTFNHWQKDPPENLYQFQGQEYQKETGWSSFKWRNAMPELGRFFKIDPLTENYVYNSPYAFSENRVTNGIELEGLEYLNANEAKVFISNKSININVKNLRNTTRRIAASLNKNPQNWGSNSIGMDIRVKTYSTARSSGSVRKNSNLSLEGGLKPHANRGRLKIGVVTTKHNIPDLWFKERDIPINQSSTKLGRRGARIVGLVQLGRMISNEIDKIN
ncbi:MAG: RHS repeat-associated core domain-containing protein, partial [Cyclobacteriaceae bacterium]